MEITKNIKTPTGNILIVTGDKGNLECLSLGDYGQAHNIKADFLGYTNKIHNVAHKEIEPLTEKWVVTISTQYGCDSMCSFCDVPYVGRGKNATLYDLINQVKCAMSIHPEITWSKRLNLHYARMGEPTWNHNVVKSAIILKNMFKDSYKLHPVVSTMMPKDNKRLFDFLNDWLDVKDSFNGEAGLQLSINTTDDDCRLKTIPKAMDLKSISDMFYDILSYREVPKGRKIALNFAVTEAEINSDKLRDLFSPKYFMCKLTPIHETKSAIENGITTIDGYSSYNAYSKIEENLKSVGFDVLTFIPSIEEDESKITCGNAILRFLK